MLRRVCLLVESLLRPEVAKVVLYTRYTTEYTLDINLNHAASSQLPLTPAAPPNRGTRLAVAFVELYADQRVAH